MLLSEILEKNKEEIITDSVNLLCCIRLKHYNSSSNVENRQRFETLFKLTIKCIQTKSILPIIEYSEGVAKQRFEDGFDFHEVHTAFNILEETIWKKVAENISSAGLSEALALISTILGSGKEALASTYISLAGKNPKRSFDLSALISRN
ncbi:MAG: hypothetical protein R6W90_05070 [Ignavibacteriaceae bacterium]